MTGVPSPCQLPALLCRLVQETTRRTGWNETLHEISSRASFYCRNYTDYNSYSKLVWCAPFSYLRGLNFFLFSFRLSISTCIDISSLSFGAALHEEFDRCFPFLSAVFSTVIPHSFISFVLAATTKTKGDGQEIELSGVGLLPPNCFGNWRRTTSCDLQLFAFIDNRIEFNLLFKTLKRMMMMMMFTLLAAQRVQLLCIISISSSSAAILFFKCKQCTLTRHSAIYCEKKKWIII